MVKNVTELQYRHAVLCCHKCHDGVTLADINVLYIRCSVLVTRSVTVCLQ